MALILDMLIPSDRQAHVRHSFRETDVADAPPVALCLLSSGFTLFGVLTKLAGVARWE
jgi:hypothetical protein